MWLRGVPGSCHSSDPGNEKLVWCVIRNPDRKRFFFGLRQKFTIAFICLVIIPLIIAGVMLVKVTSNIIEDKLKTFTVQTLEQMGKNVDYHIGELDKLTTCTLSNEDIMNYIKQYHSMNSLQQINISFQIRNWLTGLSDLNDDISGLYIFDSYHNVFYSKGRSTRINYKPEEAEWYRKTIRASGSLTIFGTHDEFHVQSQPKKVISITRELKDFMTKKQLGVIMVDISYNTLESIFKNTDSSFYQNSNLYVLDENSKIIYNKDSSFLQQSLPKDLLQQIQGKNGMVSCIVDGVPSFAVYDTSQYTNWKIISIQSQQSILKGIQPLRNVIALVIIAFLFLFIICYIYISQKLIRPIRLMSGATKQVKQGDYCVKLHLADGLVSMSSHIEELINKVFMAQLYQKDAELSALQSQINPHFLYNSLECVRGLALENGNKDVATMVKALSIFMRYNIYNGKDIVTIEDEINQIRNYITIQNMRYCNKFIVEYAIDPVLAQHKILKLTLQPLVENAILHGLEQKMGEGLIRIALCSDAGILSLTITDNGMGMPQEQMDQMNHALEQIHELQPDTGQQPVRKSIGIYNVNNRIKLYYGSQYGLHYTQADGGGVCVMITIPGM